VPVCLCPILPACLPCFACSQRRESDTHALPFRQPSSRNARPSIIASHIDRTSHSHNSTHRNGPPAAATIAAASNINTSTHQSTTAPAAARKTPQQLVRSLRQPATRLASCVHPSLPPSLLCLCLATLFPQSSIHTARPICSPVAAQKRVVHCIGLRRRVPARPPPLVLSQTPPTALAPARPQPHHLTSPHLTPEPRLASPGLTHLAHAPAGFYSSARSPLAHHLPARPLCPSRPGQQPQ